jgi:hypothetical protein
MVALILISQMRYLSLLLPVLLLKAIEVPSKGGYFVIKVKLAPTGSNASVSAIWKEISSAEF